LTPGKDGHAVADAPGGGRRKRLPREVRQHLPGRLAARLRKFLRRLQHIVVDVESRSHAWIITHHESDVNPPGVRPRGRRFRRLGYTRLVKPLPPQLVRRVAARGEGLTVLVLRMGAFGDLLRTLPVVRVLRSALPAASIRWVADDQWVQVLADHPDVNAWHALPRREWSHLLRSPLRWPALLGSIRRVVRELRSAHPDLVVDFQGNLRSGLLGLLSGAPVRLGYSGPQQQEGNRLFSTHRVPKGPRRMPRMERNLALVRAMGIESSPLPDGGLTFSVPTLQAGRDLVAGLVGRGRTYAVIAPGASVRQAYKKPPAVLLAAAARALTARGIVPVVVHGPGEEADAARIVEASSGEAALAPPTDLRMLAAIIKGARLLVAGDSGPLHLACAAGCPVVAIYGPTDPVINAPWGVPHASVFPPGRTYTGIKRKDRTVGAFEGITAEAVAAAVSEVLDRTGRS